jgi:type I restriction enzyme S subunit
LQASEFETYQIFDAGDLVFKLIDLQNIKTSRVGLVPERGIMSPAYIRLRVEANRVLPEFCYWYFTDLYNRQVFNQLGGGVRQTLGPEELLTLPFIRPTLEEQSAIAAFLDQETGKIDALVAEQERLIALLKEKRQSVISQAVTKGLNPNAPMKDSGIEWLGQVPAHWEPRKVSHLFRAGKGKNGQMLTKEFCAANEGPYPVYSGQTEDDGVMGTWCEFEFDFSENGVLFCTTVGARAMHLKQLHGRFSLSQNCMIVWPTDSRCITRFFFYHFQPLFQWERSLIPDHMQPSFRMEDLYSFSVAVPPVDEQREIFEFLDRETNKIDTLITEVVLSRIYAAPITRLGCLAFEGQGAFAPQS